MRHEKIILKIFWWSLFVLTLIPFLMIVLIKDGFDPVQFLFITEYLTIYFIAMLFMNLVNPDFYYADFDTFKKTSFFVLFVSMPPFSFPFFEITAMYGVIMLIYGYGAAILASIIILPLTYRKIHRRHENISLNDK